MNKSHEHARLMLEKAAEDLYVLERLVQDAGAPEAIIGFHTQQAIEKLVKAVLTNRAIPYARTHDLATLLDLLRLNGVAEPPEADRLPYLTPYAAEFRYGRLPPEDEEEPSLDRAWCLRCVCEVKAWAEALVGQASQPNHDVGGRVGDRPTGGNTVEFNYDDRVLKPGYTSCMGCGEALAMRLVLQACGKKCYFTNATGCSEIFTSRYPTSSWNAPWIHSLFENSAAIASGVYYALKHQKRLDGVQVVATGGDGGTADIGLQCLSGAMERNDDILYICWDNEAYMNTGVQRSGLTPLDADTTTSPAGSKSFGNDRPKKDLPMIMAAHGLAYVGVASMGYYRELSATVKRAMAIKGPKFLQIHSVCPLGWKSDPAKTIEMAKLGFDTCLYPLYEIIDGEMKPHKAPKEWLPVENYLKPQGRFRHLFRAADAASQLVRIQALAAKNIRKFYGDAAVPPFAKDAEAKMVELMNVAQA